MRRYRTLRRETFADVVLRNVAVDSMLLLSCAPRSIRGRQTLVLASADVLGAPGAAQTAEIDWSQCRRFSLLLLEHCSAQARPVHAFRPCVSCGSCLTVGSTLLLVG